MPDRNRCRNPAGAMAAFEDYCLGDHVEPDHTVASTQVVKSTGATGDLLAEAFESEILSAMELHGAVRIYADAISPNQVPHLHLDLAHLPPRKLAADVAREIYLLQTTQVGRLDLTAILARRVYNCPEVTEADLSNCDIAT